MMKILIVILILSLALFTSITKNSTKKIDDEIFVVTENLRDLKKDFENIKLEHEYLSSTEKLLGFQNLYFDDDLIKIDIQEIKIINNYLNRLNIDQLKLINE